ncbi:beta-1,4-glucuronyltransferase 1 isoform X1 [Halyomorpha halys]|uniref:beta-1,4-glucuronyltransferase 1 isoform X1 n=1 Tax=Halyomorpha halys TaxID=286706 RepID=UPI0006D52232|nr:beta-1,4-glucuronyltransferase 1-like [Halyomorpha halys]
MIIGSCAKLILLLTCIVAILQVIHLILLNHLEIIRSQRAKIFQEQKGDFLSPEQQARLIYEKLETTLNNKHYLDSTGVYRIVNLADAVRSLVFTEPNPDITLITHCTFNHLSKVIPLAKQWQGPVSVAVYSEVENIALTLWKIASIQIDIKSIKDNVSFSVVTPVPNNDEPVPILSPFPTLDVGNNSVGSFQNYDSIMDYPNNLLRNVARRASHTEFIFTIDVDMVPSENLRQEFLLFATKKGLFRKNRRYDKTVFVIPVFEAKEAVSPPLNKPQLLSLIETGEVRPFYAQICPKCQDLTNYEGWLNEPPGSEMATIFDVLWKDPWEPFYIASNNVPLYDERFKQYGFNRISQVCELHVAGYTFSVMNNGFLVHRGFKTEQNFHIEKDREQESNRLLFRVFKTELKYKYIDSSRRCY